MDIGIDPEEQVATRAAWLYFVAGLTQAQIGKKLGLNRTRVNRLLAHARDQGLVQINITGRLASCVELEEKLKQRYGLEDATVVPTPPSDDLIPPGEAVALAQATRATLKLYDSDQRLTDVVPDIEREFAAFLARLLGADA